MSSYMHTIRKKKKRQLRWWVKAVVVGLALYGIFSFINTPYRLWQSELREIDSKEHELALIQQDNERLKNRIKNINTEIGKMTEARAKGYVGKGEEIIVLPPPPVPPPPPEPKPNLWNRLFGGK